MIRTRARRDIRQACLALEARPAQTSNDRLNQASVAMVPNVHTVKCALVLTIAFANLMMPANIQAHPRCDIGKTYSILRRIYPYVVTGSARIVDIEQREGRHIGRIRIDRPKYVKWPRKDSKLSMISAQFSYNPEVECDWYPNVHHRKFVLEKAGDTFVVISSFPR